MSVEIPEVVGSHYQVTIDDVLMGYFTECSGLSAEYETYSYAEGGQNMFVHQLRGRVKYSNIVLKRGVTSSTHLLQWFQANKERSSRGGLTIKLLNRDLQVIQTWAFSCAVPIRYTAPNVSSEASGMAIETLEIAHEGLTPGVS
jgi:phage tail-like protein